MAEEAKAPPRCEFGSVILGTAAMKAEGSPEAIGDEPSCSFLMKGSKDHPSAEIMVRIWEVPARQPLQAVWIQPHLRSRSLKTLPCLHFTVTGLMRFTRQPTHPATA